uniref:Ig-like domain-containing protein n=1 Tax=Oncorhynchus tshawytscha TaxID=74940 RepID=A0AAZ3RU43_ONCTS
ISPYDAIVIVLYSNLNVFCVDMSTGRHVSVQTGGSITIPCSYDQYYINHVKYWCKGYGWTHCSSVVRTDHPKSTDRASISDDITQKVFTVIMTDLEPDDSNTYRCVVEINGGTDSMIQLLYLSVTPGTPELYVDQQEVTGVEGGSVTVRCYYSNSGDMKWCRMGGDCVSGFSGTLNGTSVTLKRTSDANNRTVLTVTMSGLKMENTDWYWCRVGELEMPVHITVSQQTATQRTSKMTSIVIRSVKVLLISLGMLVVVTAGILVTWKMWRRHSK